MLRGSCPSSTPLQWAWPASSMGSYSEDRGESYSQLYSPYWTIKWYISKSSWHYILLATENEPKTEWMMQFSLFCLRLVPLIMCFMCLFYWFCCHTCTAGCVASLFHCFRQLILPAERELSKDVARNKNIYLNHGFNLWGRCESLYSNKIIVWWKSWDTQSVCLESWRMPAKEKDFSDVNTRNKERWLAWRIMFF